MATITWFEGNDGTQNVVRRDSFSGSEPYRISSNLKRESGQNDEICSVVLEYVPVNTKITVYDNPDGRTNDDWCTLEVKAYKRKIVIRHFEEDKETGDYRLDYHRKNGLNGKISHIEIDAPAQPERSLQAYVKDSILAELGPFYSKDGQANEFESSDHHYRIWTPNITPITDRTLFINTKMDHIRGGASDDHAGFSITFDEHGLPVKIDYRIELNGEHPLASVAEIQSNVAQGISNLAANSSAPQAQVISALSQLSSAVYGKASELIGQMSETGGRQVFPDVIRGKINEIGYAVCRGYQEFFDDQSF